jgi:hypothetical protein
VPHQDRWCESYGDSCGDSWDYGDSCWDYGDYGDYGDSCWDSGDPCWDYGDYGDAGDSRGSYWDYGRPGTVPRHDQIFEV